MAKIRVTYETTIDEGDVPYMVVQRALEEDGDFNIWEINNTVKIVNVEVGDE